MKAIMISIQPQWVEKILNGEKTIEIRKTIPKCELPCKVYIYCTYGAKLTKEPNWEEYKRLQAENPNSYIVARPQVLNGKVVAEFTLKYCEKRSIKGLLHSMVDFNTFAKNCGLKNFDYENNIPFITNYAQNKDYIYAWHITDLEIYDKPKELSEFKTPPCNKSESACRNCKYLEVINTPDAYECNCWVENGKILIRPPQSWCYVEEL